MKIRQKEKLHLGTWQGYASGRNIVITVTGI